MDFIQGWFKVWGALGPDEFGGSLTPVQVSMHFRQDITLNRKHAKKTKGWRYHFKIYK
jgi:hypothetical protein